MLIPTQLRRLLLWECKSSFTSFIVLSHKFINTTLVLQNFYNPQRPPSSASGARHNSHERYVRGSLPPMTDPLTPGLPLTLPPGRQKRVVGLCQVHPPGPRRGTTGRRWGPVKGPSLDGPRHPRSDAPRRRPDVQEANRGDVPRGDAGRVVNNLCHVRPWALFNSSKGGGAHAN